MTPWTETPPTETPLRPWTKTTLYDKERAVRILLERILVLIVVFSFFRHEVQAAEVAGMAADHDGRERTPGLFRDWHLFHSARRRTPHLV